MSKFIKYLNESIISQDDISDIKWLSFDNKHHSEAYYIDLDRIFVGSKFFKLSNKNSQKHVLYHELGHYFSDKMLLNNKAWEWQDNGYFIGDFNGKKVEGINGQFTPGENIAEAFSIIIDEPNFLKKHYLNLYNDILKQLKKPEFKKLMKIKKDIDKL